MDVLDNCGLNSCGFCRGTRGDRDRPGVVEDEGNGGKFEREWSEVDGAGATGEEADGVSQGEGEDPVVDVDDRLDGKGTGGEKHQLGAVEEEGNGGGG